MAIRRSIDWSVKPRRSVSVNRGHAQHDVALVLSGGAINGLLMELGFLKRVRESPLWHRVGWIFGTSAGALAGTMATLDRIADLERFLLSLRPDEVFRPNRLWRLPLLGLHEYALPHTIDSRIGELRALAEELVHADHGSERTRLYEAGSCRRAGARRARRGAPGAARSERVPRRLFADPRRPRETPA